MTFLSPVRFYVLIFLSTVSSTTYEHTANPGLVPFYYGDTTYYYISTFKANIETAEAECSKLNNFKLLSLESEDEVTQILEQIRTKEMDTPLWTSGTESTMETGDTSTSTYVWKSTSELFSFPNFSESNITKVGLMKKRRSPPPCQCTTTQRPTTPSGIPCTTKQPDCKPVKCDIKLPDCSLEVGPCNIKPIPPSDCSVSPQTCHATCPGCRIVKQKECRLKNDGPIKCTAIPGTCDLCFQNQTSNCRIVEERQCTTIRPDCIVSQPNCTIPPVEDICTPAPTSPCTTSRPCETTAGPCTTTCTTTKAPCKSVTDCGGRSKRSEDKEGCITRTICSNRTVTTCTDKCKPSKTTCRPVFDCRPIAWVCMTPAVICNNTQTYCPPPVTTCTSPKIKCDEPEICCTKPTYECEEPEVICEPAEIVCDPTEVSCSSPVGHCQEPIINCPEPKSKCPAPIETCEAQPPCEVSEPTCWNPEVPTCKCKRGINNGCLSINTKEESKWQLESCNKEHYFICESSDKII